MLIRKITNTGTGMRSKAPLSKMFMSPKTTDVPDTGTVDRKGRISDPPDTSNPR